MIVDKTFRVAIHFEEAVLLKIQAASEQEAKDKAHSLAEEHATTTECYPAEFKADVIHRDYWAIDAEESEV